MATVTIVLMPQGSSAFVGPENKRRKDLAKHIKGLYAKYGDNWVNNYQKGDVVSVVGDINNFDIAKII